MRHRLLGLALFAMGAAVIVYAQAQRWLDRACTCLQVIDALDTLEAVCVTDYDYRHARQVAETLHRGSHLSYLEAIKAVTDAIRSGFPSLTETDLYLKLYPIKE